MIKNNFSFLIRFLICSSIFTFSCGKINNSSSLDQALYGGKPEGSAQFLAVNSILSAKCNDCHGAWSSFSQDDFVSNGLIVPESIESSKLFYRNQNVTIGPGPHDMPNGGLPALTTTELQTMVDWINSI